jgi:hypothetical protein
MRHLLVLILLVLGACGKKHEPAQSTAPAAPTCIADPGAEMIQYPDGITRKSIVVNCTYSSGEKCIYASFVNDLAVTFTNCH